MSANEKCPFCGSGLDGGIALYSCGSNHYDLETDTWSQTPVRTSLCKERELRQRAEAELETVKKLLLDPVAVHVNMLKGTIAKLSWGQIQSVNGVHPSETENANLRELLDRAYRYVPFPPDTEDCGCDECKFITEIRAEYSQLTNKTNEQDIYKI